MKKIHHIEKIVFENMPQCIKDEILRGGRYYYSTECKKVRKYITADKDKVTCKACLSALNKYKNL